MASENELEPISLNVTDAAKFLKMSRSTFYRRRKKCTDFPVVRRDGGLRKVKISDLRRWEDGLEEVQV